MTPDGSQIAMGSVNAKIAQVFETVPTPAPTPSPVSTTPAPTPNVNDPGTFDWDIEYLPNATQIIFSENATGSELVRRRLTCCILAQCSHILTFSRSTFYRNSTTTFRFVAIELLLTKTIVRLRFLTVSPLSSRPLPTSLIRTRICKCYWTYNKILSPLLPFGQAEELDKDRLHCAFASIWFLENYPMEPL